MRAEHGCINRRLAPDAYEGVADVHGPDGRPCEHLVVMARMPAQRRLSTIIADGVSGAEEVRQIARTVAAFHARADRSEQIASAGDRDAVRNRWDGVLAGIRDAGRVVDAGTVEQLERLAAGFLAGRAQLFADRVAAGRVVDGHGDLLRAPRPGRPAGRAHAQ